MSGWHTWLWPAIGVLMAAAVVGLVVFRSGNRVRLLVASVAAAVVASVAGPAAYAWSVPSGSTGGTGGTNPTAGPTTGNGRFGGENGQLPGGMGEMGCMPVGDGTPGDAPDGMGGGAMDTAGASTEPIACLKKHQGGAKWLLAAPSSQSAAQLIPSSGEPVISMWGWSGSDKAMTLAELKELVEKGELRYIQIGGGGMGGGPGAGSNVSSEVTEWVRKNATAVKGSDYSKTASTSSSTSSSTSNTSMIYRLDPSDVN